MKTLQPLHTTPAGVLDIAWYGCGPEDGPAVFLMHGFPYDIHSYVDVAPLLGDAGCRSGDTPRSGEQAALGADLLALMDALRIPRAVLAGYDWGGRAACVVAALWPQRCSGLVSYNNYNIHDIARAMEPDTPVNERRYWYQYYFHCERGRAGLAKDRRALTRLLWQLWSPSWKFDEATFERTAAAFDNEDFVEVVIHSYRQRYGLAAGDPAYADIERQLARQPVITVPTITFDGADDGVRDPSPAEAHARFFSGPRSHRIVPGVGHNMPQEAPRMFADAVLELVRGAPA
jgi:pimeloyl-ACP methyl ester carboxylesterase